VGAGVPLLLIPLIVGQYGIVTYGLIVLTRILLPTGTLAIFDFGNAEVATQIVAQGKHSRDWEEAGRRLTALASIAAGVGVAVSIAMGFSAGALAELFHVPVESRAGFQTVLLLTSLLFTPLLLTLTVEGVLKGFEEFRKLRTAEFVSVAAYGVAALIVLAAHLAFEWLAIAYLASLVVRAGLLFIIVQKFTRREGMRFGAPRRDDWTDIRHRCLGMVGIRMAGAAQSQAAPLLISSLLGPSALGVYDLIVRFPRFLKVLTGLMNTAVLPVSARLDVSGDVAGMRRLGEIGLLGALAGAAPICAWGASFAEPLLSVWVGESVAQYWRWVSLLFVLPLVNAMTSFGVGALLVRPRAVKKLNVIVFAQIILQLGIGLGFMHRFGERSFILGQAIAVTASFPFQMWLVAVEKQLVWPAFRRHFALVAIFAAGTAICLAFDVGRHLHSIPNLGVSLVLWMILSYWILWAAILMPDERAAIRSMLPFGRGKRRV
jgi:O-antigen/teichoic acid export membrane protein